MTVARSTPFELRPAKDVAVAPCGFVALGPEPWLEVRPASAFRPGATVEVAYSAGLTDHVARPVLQFRAHDDRSWNALMPAPSEGAAFWRGQVPPETVEVRISPTDLPGAFSFQIESVRILSSREMVRLRMASPRRSLLATGARMARLREDADLNLRWVLERAETQNFDQWRARRRRTQPVEDHARARVAVFVACAHEAEALQRTCASLLAQTHLDWRVLLSDPSAQASEWAGAHADPRISGDAPHAWEFAMRLRAGDTLVAHALSAFLAEFARHARYDIVYSDEARRRRAGAATEPVFKPGWSPTRQAFSPYVGRAAMLRVDAARLDATVGAAAPQALVDAALAAAAPGAVGHVARALVETVDAAPTPARMDRRARAVRTPARKVTIIIPTRDRIRLLARCLKSLFARTSWRDYDVLVIDNGSVEPATIATLEKFERDEPRLTVARNPMPFNFGALCNFGVARTHGDIVVFLNNDTVILQAAWIERMLEFATQPDVGAVGCKLIYPSGQVQHAGVVLGMGGVSGHFGEGLGRRAGGWLGGSLAPHETSAVTAACMMVERAKFDSVAGFDADNLPIELNDIDLCLRLDARGWRTICDCRVMVAHHQSASRGGATLRPQSIYRTERQYFLTTWGAAIRNDRFFNPNLSLYDREPKLA